MPGYDNIFSALNNTVWAITPEKFDEISAMVKGLKAKDAMDIAFKAEEQHHMGIRASEDREASIYDRVGIAFAGQDQRIAVVPIRGTMMKRMNLFSRMSGGTSTELLTAAVKQLSVDNSVKGVAFQVDSPGGSVEGLTGLRNAIRDLGKPSMTIADDMMASAAYFVGSAADNVYATPDAIVGSIGTITSRWDYSDAYEEAGIQQHIWRSKPYKALGHASEPLTSEESKETQRMVDSYYGQFVQAVAENRFNGNLEQAEAVADGRVYVGAEAVTKNLVDNVLSVDEAIAQLDNSLSAEEKFDGLKANYSKTYAALEEANSTIAELTAQNEALQAQIDQQATVAAEQKADNFISELVAKGKLAPKADHTDLRANLVSNFDAFSKVFDHVPAGSAAPASVEPSNEPGQAEALDAKIAKAKEEGKRVAMDADEAQVYDEMGIDYVKGFAE